MLEGTFRSKWKENFDSGGSATLSTILSHILTRNSLKTNVSATARLSSKETAIRIRGIYRSYLANGCTRVYRAVKHKAAEEKPVANIYLNESVCAERMGAKSSFWRVEQRDESIQTEIRYKYVSFYTRGATAATRIYREIFIPD